MFSDTDISSRLKRVREGDRGAAAELFPLVHAELHRLARKHMADQRASHTLQPTALVNEAYLKLVQNDRQDLADRPHFFRLAASAMRTVLVDHARTKQRQKRGGDRLQITFSERLYSVDAHEPGLLDLDGSLNRLAKLDEQLAQIVELRFFGGLTSEQIGELLEISGKSVDRGWKVAKGWLKVDLERQAAGEGAGA